MSAFNVYNDVYRETGCKFFFPFGNLSLRSRKHESDQNPERTQPGLLLGKTSRVTAPIVPQGREEMCLSLEHQNPLKTSEKMGYFDRVTVSLHSIDRKPRD